MTCAAAEPQLTRVLRIVTITLLILVSAVLAILTRPTLEFANALTVFRLAAFVAMLGMLGSSIAAFWWRDASLRRAEWAGYLAIALLIAEQFALGPGGRTNNPAALVFGLLVLAVVLARVSRRTNAPACNCG